MSPTTANEQRILVVDDTPLARQGTALRIENMGFAADRAVDGEDAICRIEEQEYSLILMDYKMPGMNGIECSMKIREIESYTGKQTPIILFSSITDEDLEEKSINAGLNGYLDKACTTEQLQNVITRYLCAHQ